MQERKMADLKIKIALAGGDPDFDKKGHSNKMTKEEALEYQKDPLKSFPYDVDFSVFSDDKVDQLFDKSKMVIESGAVLDFDQKIKIWDEERVRAIRGSNMVLKRASVNDFLWHKLQLIKECGNTLDLDTLKLIVQSDFAMRMLYPNIGDIKEYNAYRSANKLDPEEMPKINRVIPEWYGTKWSKEGRLPLVLGKVKRLMGFNNG